MTFVTYIEREFALNKSTSHKLDTGNNAGLRNFWTPCKNKCGGPNHT
jgi:hypothetical protein